MKVILILLSIFLVLACSSNIGASGTERGAPTPKIWPSSLPIPANQPEEPTKSGVETPQPGTWDFVVKAGTYVFYAKNCWKAGDDVVIKGYWADLNGKWAWYNGYRTFSAKTSRPLNVTVKEKPSNETAKNEAFLASTFMEPNRVMNLRTVQRWEGDSSREIRFYATKSPWVINAGHTPTSTISTKFDATVWKGNMGAILLENRFGPLAGVSSAIIEETGYFTIKVESSGSKWWVKVGVEP